jgi:hypothetical protein
MRLSPDALEVIKKLIKTMIKVNGSHEFLRTRLRTNLEKQYLTLNDAYRSLDSQEKGLLNAYDMQDLLSDFRRNCSREDFIQEIELLLDLYDRRYAPGTSQRGISHWSFIEGLTPQQQRQGF